MNPTLAATLVGAGLLAAVGTGMWIRRRLPAHHLSADSKDAVKLALGFVATMTALLLSLLLNSAKGTYDTQRTEVIQLAAKIAFLDRVLTAYGPEAVGAHTQFRSLVAEMIRGMWPDEGGTGAQLAPDAPAGDRVYAAIQALAPHDETQRGLKAQAAALAAELGQIRTRLLARAVPSIPRLFLIAVVGWLVIVFLGFSVLAPPNATTILALISAAASIAVALFLILELDHPLGDLIRVSGAPMLNAVNPLTK